MTQSPLADALAPGRGLAILVNANAKRGGRRVAVQIGQVLRGADVRLTKRQEEIDSWLRSLRETRCILAAGGDGTAVALVNALERVHGANDELPLFGVLPLGTGNAWANVTGAGKLHRAVDRLRTASGVLPHRRYTLVECEGRLSHFAGSGWDAEILEDFRAQLAAAKGPSKRLAKSVYGYLSAMVLRTAPKSIILGPASVVVENLGGEVYVVDADCKVVAMPSAKRGTIIYEGPASMAGAATNSEFGYRFRAYPFAERMPGFINVRVCSLGAAQALPHVQQFWRGAYPVRGLHDWFVQHVRMTFSRPVSLQIGGDAYGLRQTVEYVASPRRLRVLDWRRL